MSDSLGHPSATIPGTAELVGEGPFSRPRTSDGLSGCYLLVALLMLLASMATAAERFPPPDFSDHTAAVDHHSAVTVGGGSSTSIWRCWPWRWRLAS